MDRSQPGAVRLAQPTSPAQRPDQPPELEITHRPIIRRGRCSAAYWRLTMVSMSGLRFRTVIEAATGGGAAARIPPDIGAQLGGLKQMRVTASLNGLPIRTSTMPYRGGLYVGVHKAARAAAGAEIGDEVELELMRDNSPRVLELAPELEAAFAAEPGLRERFDALSFSRRRELADPIRAAKKPETRAARLEKALDALRED
jgi:hypothetical protein